MCIRDSYGSGFKRKDVYGTTRVINGYEFYVIEYPGEPVVPAEKTEGYYTRADLCTTTRSIKIRESDAQIRLHIFC